MRCKIIAPIQGDLFASQDNILAERDGYLFQLVRDQTGKITHISINAKVPDEIKHKFKSTFEPSKGMAKFSIHIGGDKEFYDLLTYQLRAVETELAFATRGAFWRILWNDIEYEFLPQTSDEVELTDISGFSLNQKYPSMPTEVTSQGFAAVIEMADDKSQLQIPKSFWQEGMNFFRTYNYVQAFYSFFFILEDFFAQGKTSESEVVKRFARSEEFREAAEYVFNSLKKEERHKANLQKFFSEEQLGFNKENLPKFLFSMRGRTHHYSSRNPKIQATPYSQKDFESISFLTMVMTSYILANRVEKVVKETGKGLIFSRPSTL